MITRPIVFASHCTRLVGMANGNKPIMVSTSSVEHSRLSVPPIAISEVEGKGGAGLRRPHDLHVPHPSLAVEHAMHPDLTVAIHVRAQAVPAARCPFDRE